MTKSNPGISQPKWAARSITILGTLLTGAVVLAPVVGLNFGQDDAALITQGWDAVLEVIGIGTAIVGRFKASRPVTLLPTLKDVA
ncbi:MAG: hypothetical protein ACFBZ9_10575 [Sphingomonadales bacterium]